MMDNHERAVLPEELINYLRSGEVILFAGAGLSINAGLPGWGELAKPFADRVGYHWPAPEDLTTEHFLNTFQFYENQFGRNRLLMAIMDQLASLHFSPALAHYLITLLPVQKVFTTNYDNLLERACADVLLPARVAIKTVDLAYLIPSSMHIIKLCGDLDQPDSIVITRSDFNLYGSDGEQHQPLINCLLGEMETRTVLFLGYSLRDPFLNRVWDVIQQVQGRHRRRAYAILFHVSALEAEDLRRRDITPLIFPVEVSPQVTLNGLLIDTLKSLGKMIPVNQLDNVMKNIPPGMARDLDEYYRWYIHLQQ